MSNTDIPASRASTPPASKLTLFKLVLTGLVLLLLTACVANHNGMDTSEGLELLAYRLRADFHAPLNADSGWATAENTAARLYYDEPFRLRAQVRARHSSPDGHLLSLQYRRAQGPWQALGYADFPYPRLATPVISAVSSPAYDHGEETERLLGDGQLDWDEGLGLNGIAATEVWRAGTDALEWEWPLVVRRFSDGPEFHEDGERFQLRLVDGLGQPLSGSGPIELQLSAAPGHLGGTFIETPGRIGPYQSRAGHLYFFMEPTETDNRFMAMGSTDFGRSWREVDGANRPVADDLEGVASVRIGDTVHILHQVSEELFHHAFAMAEPAGWVINSHSIASFTEPPTQFVDVAARSDGSLVTLYAGAQRLFLQTRSAQGDWGEPVEIDSDRGPVLSGPVMVTGADDVVTLAYTGMDGRGFVRHLEPDGSLSERLLLASNLGTRDEENGAILPLIAIPETGETVVLYRETDGLLYERRFSAAGQLNAPVPVSGMPVVSNAADSEQAGADIVRHGTSLYLVFIEPESRDIYYTYSEQAGSWAEPVLLLPGLDAAWLRGSVHLDASGNSVYGFVYDGGSGGGAGRNDYYAIPL